MLSSKTKQPKFLPPAAASAEVGRTAQALEAARAAEQVISASLSTRLREGRAALLLPCAWAGPSSSAPCRPASSRMRRPSGTQPRLPRSRSRPRMLWPSQEVQPGPHLCRLPRSRRPASLTRALHADGTAEHRKDLEIAMAFSAHFATVAENTGFVVQDDERAVHEAEVQSRALPRTGPQSACRGCREQGHDPVCCAGHAAVPGG